MVDAYESKEGKDGKTGLKEGGFRLSILKIVVLFAVFFVCNESIGINLKQLLKTLQECLEMVPK